MRRKVAQGKEKGMPAAANMKKMVKVEFSASHIKNPHLQDMVKRSGKGGTTLGGPMQVQS